MKTIITNFLIAALFIISPQFSFAELLPEQKNLETTQKQIIEIDAQIEAFRNDVGRYPSNEEGFAVLIENSAKLAGWKGPYLTEESLIDPWDMRIRYITPHSQSPKEYGVYSLGINVIDNVGYVDDVTSWNEPDASYYHEKKQPLPFKSMAGVAFLLFFIWGDIVRRQRNKKKLSEKA